MKKNPVRLVLVAIIIAAGAICGCSKALTPVSEIHIDGMPLDSRSEILSKLNTPIENDATVQVPGRQESIIVNVFPTDENGKVKPGASPEVIMARDTDFFKLDNTMSKKELASGNYLMNIVFGGKTERVAFVVK
ncbi:MAG: hypothetical protein JXA24_06245 [Proteobacteria bacterium]|nr:hypothetical protein [Pseudomonadota bacterium]